MGLFLQMSHNQPLPVPVQLVLAAPGGRHHAAALGQGLQQQVHLRIVAQGLKVAHALHGAVDGLLIQNPAPVQVDLHAEALRHQAFENFRLDAAHQGHMNFPSVRGEAQLGVLLLQLAQLGQQGAAVAVRRQGHPIAHHRLQHRPDAGFLRPQALAAAGRSAAEIKALLEQTKFDSDIYITVDTLKYLKKGGRCTPAAAAIGTVLNLKPVLRIKGEKLDSFAKARGWKAAKKTMLDTARRVMETDFAGCRGPEDLHIAAAFTGTREEAQEWLEELDRKQMLP